MIYRALQALETGKRKIEKGHIFPASWLTDKALVILERNGAIVPEPMPPKSSGLLLAASEEKRGQATFPILLKNPVDFVLMGDDAGHR